MGLAGRKVKQRIPADPRNLSWADDAARFGANYLAKFGWDASKGLGASGDGRTSHINVAHKLDTLGIGAAHQRDPNGIAWKQNKDFENLLIRLNEQTGQSIDTIGEVDRAVKMDSDDAAEKPSEDEQRPSDIMEKGKNKKWKEKKRRDEEPRRAADVSTAEGSSNDADVSKTKKKKERKHLGDGEAAAVPPRDKQESRKKKKEEKRKREDDEEARVVDPARGKKRRKEKGDESEVSNKRSEESFLSSEAQKVQQLPQRRAHRARAIASKNLTSKSAAAISEILGIPFTPPASTTPASSSATPNSETSMALGKLTTSTQSVGDYFKQKLINKSLQTSELASASDHGDIAHEDDEPRRGGIGSIRAAQAALAQDTAALGFGFKSFASLTSSFVMTTLSRSGGDSDASPAETDEKAAVDEEKDNPASWNVSEKEKRKHSKKKTCKEKKYVHRCSRRL